MTSKPSSVREFEQKILNVCPQHRGYLYEGSNNTVCCHGTPNGDNQDRHVLYRSSKEANERTAYFIATEAKSFFSAHILASLDTAIERMKGDKKESTWGKVSVVKGVQERYKKEFDIGYNTAKSEDIALLEQLKKEYA